MSNGHQGISGGNPAVGLHSCTYHCVRRRRHASDAGLQEDRSRLEPRRRWQVRSLCFHKEKYKLVGTNTQAITELQLIVGKDAPTPAGFRNLNTDLNLDAGGDYVYLCYKVDDYDPATAIIAITAFWGTDEDVAPPYGFVKLPTDVNLNAGSKIIFLSYAKKGTTMIIDFHL